jgi:hypothetical protein
MQLLIQLPRLPFSVVFDILFRHGGFAAFVDAHGTSEAMYQFWRIFFVSSPMGRLDPSKISAWVEAVCACHIVQSLPHPGHAVYLLRSVRHEIPESVFAWSVAGGRGNQVMSPATVVGAMKVFLQCDRRLLELPCLQREWFCVSELFFPRSIPEWVLYADEVMSNHSFTHYWWNQQKECPFYLLQGASSEKASSLSMGKVIKLLVQRETLALEQSLKREETTKMIRALQRKLWKKEQDEIAAACALEKEQARIAAARAKKPKPNGTPINKNHKQLPLSTPIRKNSKPLPLSTPISKNPKPLPLPTPSQSKPTDTPVNKKPPPLSRANKQEILHLTQSRYTEHTSILAQARSVLSSMQVTILDTNFQRVLGLVVSIGKAFPRIKWSVKLALHMAAIETGRSVWDVERGLYNMLRKDKIQDPLAKLKALAS